MSGGIITLDLATRTGWALGSEETIEVWPLHGRLQGAQRIPGLHSGFKNFSGLEPAHRYVKFNLWLREMILVNKPAYLVFEAALPPSKMGGKSNLNVARTLLGMVAITELIGQERGLNFFEVNVQHIKKHMTGHGHANKDMMVNAARQRGWNVKDDNEADALALMDYSIHQIKIARRQAS